MASGVPKSSRYVDPASRQMAEDLARRSGLSLNEWVTRLMAEGPEDATSQDYFTQGAPSYYEAPRAAAEPRYEAIGHPADEVGRVTQALERLSDRIGSAENRQALAIAGVERSVREVIGRIDAAEREQMQVAARFEGELQTARGESKPHLTNLLVAFNALIFQPETRSCNDIAKPFRCPKRNECGVSPTSINGRRER